MDVIGNTLDSLNVLNMLNMKYLIYNKESAPLVNPYANGSVWLINKVRLANDANEEMMLLGHINTKKEMVVDKRYASQLPQKMYNDTTSRIVLSKYEPNRIVYNFSSITDQIAVFSEIFYENGWNAYIKGQQVPYIRANYLLRSMPLKAGVYDIEFKFEPNSYKIGNLIAMISSALFILCLVGFAYWQIMQLKRQKMSEN
jgi:hypothetical protein